MSRKKKRTFAQYLRVKRKKRNTKGLLKIIKGSKKNVNHLRTQAL
jgi:hypothetical protein